MDSKITAKNCIHLANDVIVNRNLLIPRLTSIKDINYSLFVLIFEDIFGVDFHELSSIKPKSKSQEIKLMAKLMSFISKDLFSISLDHIKAVDLIEKDLVSIHNFLEIISTFVKYIPKELNESKSSSKYVSKYIQTNNSKNISFVEKFKSNEDLFCTLDKPNYQTKLRPDSTSSPLSAHSISSESRELTVPMRRRSLRQMNSCVDCEERNRKQELLKESKAIQTETQLTPKSSLSTKDISFDEYKRLKCENFATLLGHRLHETLKLKELTDIIDYKIKRYYGDVTTKTPQRIASKSSVKSKSVRKTQKKSPQVRKPLNSTTHPKSTTMTSSFDDILNTFPEISRNTIKSLKDQERHQKKVIENLNKDIICKELKVKSKLKDAIETQQKRSHIIRNDLKHLEVLAQTKGSKLAQIKENASKRDSRMERIRIKRMVDKYDNELKSKYKQLLATEEQIVLNEYQKREKEQKDYINDLRKRVNERHGLELDKQKKMLDAFETLYQNKYQILSENLDEEEKRLKNEISSQSHYLRSLNKDFNQKFENDFRNLFKD